MRSVKWAALAIALLLLALAVALTVFDIRLGPGDGRILRPTTSPTSDVLPVSISNPGEGALDAFAKCHVGDQFSIEQVAGMGQVSSATDLFHYVPLTGREPEFKADNPAWVIQFRGELPMRFGLWTDPVCIVTADHFGYYATGASKDYNSDKVMTPEPPPTPPDRSLPPLLP